METADWQAMEAGRLPELNQLRPIADTLGLKSISWLSWTGSAGKPEKLNLERRRTFLDTGGAYSNAYRLISRKRR